MSGNANLLLDSNICVYLSKNVLNTADIAQKGDILYISVITYMEILGYNFDVPREEEFITKLAQETSILPITDAIANNVIAYRKKRKIKLPDAILLATARENNCTLVTRNTEDFRNLDDQVNLFNPFEK